MKTIVEMLWSTLYDAIRLLIAPRPLSSSGLTREGWLPLSPIRPTNPTPARLRSSGSRKTLR
jgi:hypothetical protein